MAAILSFEIIDWEKLFWFLKFLIPKLKVIDPNKELLDELLDSVDLSSYGLERVKLNYGIGLDESETELKPQNPNPRGAHDEPERDPLDEIIRNFNERWFQGWSATPEEQRVKFLSLADSIRAHPDFEEKYQNNPDSHNRNLAFNSMFDEIMLKNRRNEMELYNLLTTDSAFRAAMRGSLRSIVGE
ncbi:MAG: type I restriction enzyme R subunit [Parasphingorhabdus sp.]|jgi:type I restriction enzyme R subunit